MAERISLKVHVDAERCQGHNRCYAIAPELFEIDELGNSRARATAPCPRRSKRKRGSQ
jgi:ferredoxin